MTKEAAGTRSSNYFILSVIVAYTKAMSPTVISSRYCHLHLAGRHCLALLVEISARFSIGALSISNLARRMTARQTNVTSITVQNYMKYSEYIQRELSRENFKCEICSRKYYDTVIHVCSDILCLRRLMALSAVKNFELNTLLYSQ